MMDLKALNAALEQLEAERGIPKEKILEAVEDALAAAYKKDYGKRGQVIRAHFDALTGAVSFEQVKTVVDENEVKMPEEDAEQSTVRGTAQNLDAEEKKKNDDPAKSPGGDRGASNDNDPVRTDAEQSSATSNGAGDDEEEVRIRYNPEQHLFLEEAKRIKKDAKIGDEIVFPLEARGDYGRIAAQTAKQVIIQRIREAERISAREEFESKRGEIISGTVQRIERGNIFVDLGKTTAVLPRDEQIPGEYFRQGERIRAYLFDIIESARDITLYLSRSHPKLLLKLMEVEVPEIASGVVEVKAIAREAGSRSKIAVATSDEHIDPVGSCVGQRGVRVTAVMNELGGEKIDIIEWAEDPALFIERALSPAHVENVELDEEEHRARILVAPDQYSLAIGKNGQNARLAARLTGWKIDIREATGRAKMEAEETEQPIQQTTTSTTDPEGTSADGASDGDKNGVGRN